MDFTTLATDAAGVAIPDSRTWYKPYGEIRAGGSTLPTDRRFTGQRSEASLGLLDYRARMYDPLLARFLSADTIVPSPSSPQSLNRYSYVLNSPLNYRDPSGHAACIDADCSELESPAIWMRIVRRLQYGYGRCPRFVVPPVEISKMSTDDQNGFGNTEYAYEQRHGIYSQLGGLHSGVDIGAPNGTPVYAMDYGVVVCTGMGCFMGTTESGIAIRSGDYIVVAGHVQEIELQKGDVVMPGTKIAAVGDGHLHLEVRRIGEGAPDDKRHDQFYNPLYFFKSSLLERMSLTWDSYVDKSGNLSVDYNEWTMVSYTRPGNWFDGTLTAVQWRVPVTAHPHGGRVPEY